VEVSCRASKLTEFPPTTWDCFGQNKFGVEFTPFQLIKVDEASDPLCSEFEADDGDAIVKFRSALPTPAPGLK